MSIELLSPFREGLRYLFTYQESLYINYLDGVRQSTSLFLTRLVDDPNVQLEEMDFQDFEAVKITPQKSGLWGKVKSKSLPFFPLRVDINVRICRQMCEFL